ncbi:LacI family transcriptional regulator [Histidinibacterium aquaticum]|uniref:LacI family DNA-binding transcriptional regulator n=1 Tax=Histidinibacterium aquaticum TaxID=2613962 RepID=A0A5J5GDL7_9RHOB|nr:LacI family transcriptional regulator [Histidinibacterium aquaticum]KAA9006127.1 LacI family DNA-binding transcriptional regulator [Histidinibacterium aquaticum]
MTAEARPAGTKPTLKTIAELSGLAVPTVSRALNDAPDIGARTKELVRRIALEIGYVPNRAGVRLRTGRTQVIALIISTEHEIMNHTARMISSIAGGLKGTAFHLNVTPYFPDEDPMRAVRYVVENRLADAVILNQTQPRDPRVAYLRERGFPFATHGRTDWCESHPYFDFDNLVYGRIGTEKLIERGRREIAVLAPPLDQMYSQHIVAGAAEAAKAAGARHMVIEGATTNDHHEKIRAAVHAQVEARPKTDAIISSSASGAMAAVAALEAEGLVLGRDVDVCGKESLPILTLFRPEIVAVQEDVARAGAFLARAAMQAILEPDAPPLQGLDIPDT